MSGKYRAHNSPLLIFFISYLHPKQSNIFSRTLLSTYLAYIVLQTHDIFHIYQKFSRFIIYSLEKTHTVDPNSNDHLKYPGSLSNSFIVNLQHSSYSNESSVDNHLSSAKTHLLPTKTQVLAASQFCVKGGCYFYESTDLTGTFARTSLIVAMACEPFICLQY